MIFSPWVFDTVQIEIRIPESPWDTAMGLDLPIYGYT